MLLFGILVAGGFQAQTLKFGMADLGKVAEGSDYYKGVQATFNDMVERRKAVLEFFNTYKVLTTDEAKRIKELSLKVDITPQEKAELDRLKEQVITDDKRKKELAVKTPLTPEEQTLSQEFTNRERTITSQMPQLSQEFSDDIEAKKNEIQQSAFDKARAAVLQVGKEGGYTLVFTSAAAPYGANDITDDAIKAENAKK